MCGRTACTLAPSEICKACSHRDKQGHWTQPQWLDPPGGQKYYPSHNVTPTSHTPVLLSAKNAKKRIGSAALKTTSICSEGDMPSLSHSDWVIQPMHWGLVPSWHHGETKTTGFNMINARSDGILTKTSFKQPLENGQRCVVIVEGYYEWQTTDGSKQPYYIYFPTAELSQVDDVNKCMQQTTTEDQEVWTGGRVLTLAAIYDTWENKDGEILYSYAIITVDAHQKLSWMHDRMPAVLDGEEEVRKWLDSTEVPLSKAVELIRPLDCIDYHPVSKVIGDVRNKSAECIKPIDLEHEKRKKSASSNFMKSWLNKVPKRKSETSEDLLENEIQEKTRKT